MSATRTRTAAVLAAALSLILAGCAVPGKGDPGVAATYDGRTVTVQDVIDARATLEGLGTPTSIAGQPLTLLLLGPDIIAAAEDAGLSIADDQLPGGIALWMAYAQRGGNPPPGSEYIVKIVLSVALLAYTPGGLDALEAVAEDASAGVVASPRYGDFSVDAFKSSVLNAMQDVSNNALELQAAYFTVFKQVNGFAGSHPDWISGE